MFDTISQYIDKMPIWGWILTGIVVLILGILSTSDETITSSEDEEDEEDDMTDTITCTVPGQPVIVLRPNEFSSFDEAYTGIWEVTLRNGNCILLPMQYTTILDNSMDITTL